MHGDGVKVRFLKTVPGHNEGEVKTLSVSAATKFLDMKIDGAPVAEEVAAGPTDGDAMAIRFLKTVPGHNAGEEKQVATNTAKKFIAEGVAEFAR